MGKLLVMMAVFGLTASAFTDQQMLDIEERIKPVGKVCIAGGSRCIPKITNDSAAEASNSPAAETPRDFSTEASSSSRSGKDVYDSACMACHMTGAGGAPKLGDVVVWVDRIASGMNALYESGIKGMPGTAMMAKGGCMTCTDEEFIAAVDYIIDNSQ